ncbi:MAG: hypothetical protein WCA96_04805, partial [Methylocella sp.]
TRPVWPLIRVKHVPKKLLDFFDKDSLKGKTFSQERSPGIKTGACAANPCLTYCPHIDHNDVSIRSSAFGGSRA